MTPTLFVFSIVGLIATAISAHRAEEALRSRAAMFGFWAGLGAAGLSDPDALPFSVTWVVFAYLLAGSGIGIVFTPMADPNRVTLSKRHLQETGRDPRSDPELLRMAAPDWQDWIVVSSYALAASALVVGGLVLGSVLAAVVGLLGLAGSAVTLVRFRRFRSEVTAWQRHLDLV